MTIFMISRCGWPTEHTEADRQAGRKIRYCTKVAGHFGHPENHEHLPDDHPESYESVRRQHLGEG